MASIYAQGNVIWISFTDAYGIRQQHSLKIPTTREGWAKARDLKRRVEAELTANALRFTLEQGAVHTPRQSVLLSALLEDLEAENAERPTMEKRSPSTLRLMHLTVRKFRAWVGDLPVSRIDTTAAMQFRARAIREDGEQNAAIWVRTLGSIMGWAVKRNYSAANPITKQVRIRTPMALVEVMTDEELKALFVEAELFRGVKLRRQLEFLLLTGFRSGESCTFKRRQVRFDTRHILRDNMKGKRWSAFPLYPALREFLLPYQSLGPEEYLFHYRHPDTLSHYFAKCRDKLGLSSNYTVHTLRKNFATSLKNKGLSEPEITYLVGHVFYGVTNSHYLNWDMDLLSERIGHIWTAGEVLGGKSEENKDGDEEKLL